LRLFVKAARAGTPDASIKELAGRVLDAFDDVLDALLEYRAGHLKLRGRLSGQLDKLKGARTQDWGNFLHQMISNPEHEPQLLSALWRAAVSLGYLRHQGHRQWRSTEVQVKDEWIAETASSPWYVLLTRDAPRFGQIVNQAIVSNRVSDNSFDYVRRLRDLIRKPTGARLRNLVRDAGGINKSDMGVTSTGFGYAGRRTGIFPYDLPSDWIEQVAGQPELIAQLAQAFLDLITSKQENRGRHADGALAQYADATASSYFQLRRKPIAYARGTETLRSAFRGKSYGLGLEVMKTALQLVDSSFGASQAQAHIDRIRGRK
jgi:hypothetical protein